MTLLSRLAETIPTDHWEFFLQADRSADWAIDAKTFENRRVAACPAGLAIATARLWGQTRVEVDVHDREPEILLAGWDDLETQAIVVSDPELLLFAPETTRTDRVLRIPIHPGAYQAAVLIGGLASVTDDVGGVGDDHSRIILWPASV